MPIRERNSNIELLRILIMFMILLLHANVMSFGMPTDYSVKSFLRSFAEAFTLTPVNIFVLITGYFGTRFTIEKIGSLLYQVIFCLVPLSLLFCWRTGSSLNLADINIFNYWFINAYIGLLVFVPVLNCAVVAFTKSQFKLFLIVYYVVIALCGSFLQIEGIVVDRGYSVLWFVFLYLLGRYVSIYPPSISCVKLLVVMLLACLGKTMIIFLTHKGINYVDPFITIQSVCTLLLFARLDIKSRLVNQIAVSTTMVYLINLHPIFWKIYRIQVNTIYDWSNGVMVFLPTLFLYCLAIFSFAILYDKIRMLTWKPLSALLKKIDLTV